MSCLLASVLWFAYQEFQSNSNNDAIAATPKSLPTKSEQSLASVEIKQPEIAEPEASPLHSTSLDEEIKWESPILSKSSPTIQPASIPLDPKPTLRRGQKLDSEAIPPSEKTAKPDESTLLAEQIRAEKSIRNQLKTDALNPDLILKLADNIIHQKREDEAWLLLAKSTRTGDRRFASRLLALGLKTGKHDETLMLLDPEATGAPEWDNSDWITIALLYEKSGNMAHALELLRIHDKMNLHMPRIIVQQGRRPKDKSASLN